MTTLDVRDLRITVLIFLILMALLAYAVGDTESLVILVHSLGEASRCCSKDVL